MGESLSPLGKALTEARVLIGTGKGKDINRIAAPLGVAAPVAAPVVAPVATPAAPPSAGLAANAALPWAVLDSGASAVEDY